MTDCPNATIRDRLPDLLHGTLDAPARAAVESHLAACAECAGELALLRAARRSMERVPAVDVAAIVAALPRPAATGPRLVQFPTPAERARRMVGGRRLAWGGLAAAAAVVVAVGVGSMAMLGRGSAPSAAPIVADAGGSPPRAASRPDAAPVAPPSVPAPAPVEPEPPAVATPDRSEPLLVVNTASLSDADLAGLLDELDDLDALPAADPLSLVPITGLGTGTGTGEGS